MAWNRSTQKIESNKSKAVKSPRVWWGLGAGLIVAVAAVVGVVSFSAGTGAPSEKSASGEEMSETVPKPKQPRTIPTVTPAAAPRYNVVAEKLRGCKFLVNGQVKQKAKVYLCLFSASCSTGRTGAIRTGRAGSSSSPTARFSASGESALPSSNQLLTALPDTGRAVEVIILE